MALPSFVIDPSVAFPEVPSCQQPMSSGMRDPVSALTLFAAYLMTGNKLPGSAAILSLDQCFGYLEQCAKEYFLDLDRIMDWAESLVLDPEATMPDRSLLDPTLHKVGFTLTDWQADVAAWSAIRRGSINAMSCGLGKTGTATVAAITAVKLGKCRPTRCFIFCPANAISVWTKKGFCDELQTVFEEVEVVSVDSSHNWKHIEKFLGGALILDELHYLKTATARRSESLQHIRPGFDWAVGLTGTLFHGGAQGVMQMQDIVLPGASRFFDEWAFGESFHCIYEKQIGKRKKHAVGIPPEEYREVFARYTSRIVRSLSWQCEAVRKSFNVPDQELLIEDAWGEPDWVTDLRLKMLKADKRNRVYWLPDCRGKESTSAVAAIANAEITTDPETGEAKIPSFSKISHLLAEEGAVSRVVVTEWVDETPHDRWVYEPGSDAEHPKPGAKIAAIDAWLTQYPKEPLVLAAFHTKTVDMLAQLLDKRKVLYRRIEGGVSTEYRSNAVDAFQAGDIRVMLLQQVAGAESITLTRAAYSIIVDHSWSAAKLEQFMHRTARIGQQRRCTHVDFAFGSFQRTIVTKLRYGMDFDAHVRQQLETEYYNKTLILNPTLRTAS